MNKYRLLKTFVYGETIKLSINDIQSESVFIRVTNTHLTLLNGDGKEENIELDRITKITL